MPESLLPPDGDAGHATGASPLPAGVTAALGAWLREQRQTHRSASAPTTAVRTEETRRAVRLLCEEAHRQSAPVEQVIVLLKHLWATLPIDGLADGRVASRKVLDGIIPVCIEEFYADGAVGRGSHAARHPTGPHVPTPPSADGTADGRSLGRLTADGSPRG